MNVKASAPQQRSDVQDEQRVAPSDPGKTRRWIMDQAVRITTATFGMAVAASLFGLDAAGAPTSKALCDWVTVERRCDPPTICSRNRDCFQNYRIKKQRCCHKSGGCYYLEDRIWEPAGCCLGRC